MSDSPSPAVPPEATPPSEGRARDKYDRAIAYFTKYPGEIMSGWGERLPGSTVKNHRHHCLFARAGTGTRKSAGRTNQSGLHTHLSPKIEQK